MPPKRKRATQTKQDDEVGLVQGKETASSDSVVDTANNGHTKETEKIKLKPAHTFDARKFLQTQTESGNWKKAKGMRGFHLQTSSLAAAAALTQPHVKTPAVLNVPAHAMIPRKIAMPDLATSSSFSTLSKIQDLSPQGIQLTPFARPNQFTSLAAPASNTPCNVSMTSFTDATLISILKTCIKEHIFGKCKFYHRDKHGMFNPSPTSMCGQVMKYCRLEADASWWYKMRTVIVKTHTDHRKNCIKRLNARFKGMYATVYHHAMKPLTNSLYNVF
jgi:hypothetical protein